MKQLDLFTHPDLEEILAGPGGDMISYCFDDAGSVEELKSGVKGMLDELRNFKDASSIQQEYQNFNIKSTGDFQQFKNNVLKVLDNAEEYLNYYKQDN